jgi:hypothetical protein
MKYQSLLTVLVVFGFAYRPARAADHLFDSSGRDRSGNTKLDTKGANGFQLIAWTVGQAAITQTTGCVSIVSPGCAAAPRRQRDPESCAPP